MSFDERLALLAMKPVIDVQVCGHCNLRCAGCMHFAPLAEATFLDLDEYENDLTRCSSIDDVSSYFDAIVLMGGEPLLHPQIVEIIRMTRRHLPKILLALCTNGLLLKRMGEDFWSALIECEVDLTISPYPIHLDYNALIDFVQAKGAQARFNQDITGMCVGREMFMRLALDSDGGCNPTESFVSCPFGGHFLQLSHGAIWPCQVTAHHEYFSKRFGYDMHDCPEDSLPLERIASTDDIETFRRKSHPMCRFCDNESLTVMPWERSKFAEDEWLSPRRAR